MNFQRAFFVVNIFSAKIHYALNGDIEADNPDSAKLDLILYKGSVIMTMFNSFYGGVVVKIGLWLGVLFGFTKSIFIILVKDESEPSYEIPHIALRFNVFMGIMWGFAIGIFSIWGLYFGSEMNRNRFNTNVTSSELFNNKLSEEITLISFSNKCVAISEPSLLLKVKIATSLNLKPSLQTALIVLIILFNYSIIVKGILTLE